jgi:hypothetical protein
MQRPKKLVSYDLSQRVAYAFLTSSFSSELWHIFHDELDLDGNGQLDQGELQSALSKAGAYHYCYHYHGYRG